MSYKVYPVIDTDPFCDDYLVKVNGKEVKTNTARVSAIPFNRRWPGHQRQIEQSEAVQFLSLSTDEPLTFEITPKDPFEEVKIRPKSLGITPKTVDGKIIFTLDKPAYFTVEAFGRNRALHIFADALASYDVDINSPDVIYFGAGEHDVGWIELKSNQTLFIDEGAVVYACIRATDAENIRILGRGILDNSRNKEKILFEANEENNTKAVRNATRAHTIQIEYCTNVEIDGITIRDSLVYNVRPLGCENLNVRNVKIIGCWRYNSDGIDMHNCKNVHISDCFLRTFDDAICVKGFDFFYLANEDEATRKAMYREGKCYDTFENVLVENCVIWNDWGKALEIGAETKAEEIKNITFRNCDVIHEIGPVLDCMNVDFADVHDVTYTDINIEADEVIPPPILQASDSDTYENNEPDYMPPTISVSVVFHFEYSGGGQRRGKNRNMVFRNINVYSDKLPKLEFIGYDEEHKTENVLISGLTLNGKPITSLPDSNFSIGEFAENIRLEADPYAEMSKNTVSADGQLKESSFIKFDSLESQGKRVMFVGNSITLHGKRPEIGWNNEWGMAASAKEKDYVHILEKSIKESDPNTAFCICQVSEWERRYKEGKDVLSKYETARSFGADLIILRFIENVPSDGYDSEVFVRALDSLVDYLNPKGTAKLVITTGFWRHPGDSDLRKYAKEKGIPCVELGDLGEDDTMKAVGLFEHTGVANHPSDKGMAAIAERIMKEVTDLYR